MKFIKPFMIVLLIAITASACKTTDASQEFLGSWNFTVPNGPKNIVFNWQICENGILIESQNIDGRCIGYETINWEVPNTIPRVFRILYGDELIEEMTIISKKDDSMELKTNTGKIITFTRGKAPNTTNVQPQEWSKPKPQEASQFYGKWGFFADKFVLCYHFMNDGKITFNPSGTNRS